MLRSGRKTGNQNAPVLAEESLGTIQVRELRNARPVENQLVRQFYQLWSGDTFTKPSPKELVLARELIERHGRTKLHTLLPQVVKHSRTNGPTPRRLAPSPDIFRRSMRSTSGSRKSPNVRSNKIFRSGSRRRDRSDHGGSSGGWSPSGGRHGNLFQTKIAKESRRRFAANGRTSLGFLRCSSVTASWNSLETGPTARQARPTLPPSHRKNSHWSARQRDHTWPTRTTPRSPCVYPRGLPRSHRRAEPTGLWLAGDERSPL